MAVCFVLTTFIPTLSIAIDENFSREQDSNFYHLQGLDHAKSVHNNLPLEQEDEEEESTDQKDSDDNESKSNSNLDCAHFSKNAISGIAQYLQGSLQICSERKVNIPLFILHHAWKVDLIA